MFAISLKNVIFWLQRPKAMISRVKYWFYVKAHPDEPWLCPGTVEFCQTHLSISMSVLEFGSGRSTIWFSQRVGHLTSVEHNSDWYNSVKAKLEIAKVANVDLRLIPLDHIDSEPEQEFYEICPNYVAVVNEFEDESLDFVIVDGHYRTNCTRESLPKIKSGGYLLIDDTNMWSSFDVLKIPENWLIVDQSTNGIKTATIWQKPPKN
jgi:hypothetical protein